MSNPQDIETLLRDSLLNNSYDWDKMHDWLKNTHTRSYSYLLDLQKAYIGYEELMYHTSDITGHNQKLIGQLYVDQTFHARVDVEFDIVGAINREDYRLSDFYQKPITIEDMINNPKIFFKVPIIMIDNKVIWDWKMYVKNDKTTFSFPTLGRTFVVETTRNPGSDDVVYIDHDVTVMLVENEFYQRSSVTKTMLSYDSESGRVQVPKTTLAMQPNRDGVMFMSLHLPNPAGKQYELGSHLMPMTESENYFVGYLDDGFKSIFNTYTSTHFFISLVYIPKLTLHALYTGSTIFEAEESETGTAVAPLFVLETKDHELFYNPIPVENMIILKKDDAGNFVVNKNTNMVKLHYPNIYQISDPTIKVGDCYKVFYFYYTDSTDTKYLDLFEFYRMYLRNIFNEGTSMEEIVNTIYYNKPTSKSDFFNNMADIYKNPFITRFITIMNYLWYDHKYGEADFLKRYLKIYGNEDKDPTQYQDETLKEWMKIEPWVLHEYVLDQKRLGTTYCLYTNQIDLPSRVRKDTSREFPHSAIVFPEDRYLFAIANNTEDGKALHIRFWADGILVCDIYQRRKQFMDYLYIPCSMITDDSYLEMEIFPSYSYEQEVQFTSVDDTVEMNIPVSKDRIYPTSADLYATEYRVYGTNETDIDVIHYDRSMFDVSAHYDRGTFKVETTDEDKPVKYTRLSKFSISPTDISVELVGGPIDIRFSKEPNFIPYRVEHAGYQYIEFAFDELDWNYDLRYLRIFVNGRILPRGHYIFENQFSRPRLFFLDWFDVGAMIYIDVTPFQYNMVYYQKDISTQEPVILDLKGVIDKPFDVRYFDVYMNGRKLSLNNVFAISPWQITLVNLTSFHNLEIYERERDYEWYGLDYRQRLYPYTIEDLFSEVFIRGEDIIKLVTDLVNKSKDSRLTVNANTDSEEIFPYDIHKKEEAISIMLFYFNELVPKGYAYASELQLNLNHIRDTYKGVYDNYLRLPKDYAWDAQSLARKEKYPPAISIDCDILVEGDDPEEVKENVIYVVGHLSEVSEEILRPPIIDDYAVEVTSQNQYLPENAQVLRDVLDDVSPFAFEDLDEVLPPATETQRGIVQLNNDVTSASTDTVATAQVLGAINETLIHNGVNEDISGHKTFSDGILQIGSATISYDDEKNEFVIS